VSDASDLLGGDESSVFEHRDMLLDPGERHVELVREVADRRVGSAESLEDAASGRVGKRAECAVECSRILNHTVQYLI